MEQRGQIEALSAAGAAPCARWRATHEVGGALAVTGGPDRRVRLAPRRAAMPAAVTVEAAPVLTEALVAHLPPPVQRHLRVTGSIGKLRWRNVHARFDAKTATRGQTTSHRPEGDFVDGRFVLTRVRFDVKA